MRFHWWLLLPLLLLSTPLTAAAQPGPKKIEPRLDQYGDPLPEHAILRIGTTRLRSGGAVRALAFTSDAKGLVGFTRTTGAILWDSVTGKETLTFGKPASSIFGTVGCAASADGSLIAMIESRETCLIYDTATGKPLRAIKAVWDNGSLLCFSEDKKLFAFTDKDLVVRVWDLTTSAVVAQCQLPKSWQTPLRFMTFSPDAKTLAISAPQQAIELWQFAPDKRSTIGANPKNMNYADLAFSADGKILAAIESARRGVSLWDAATGQKLDDLPVEPRNQFCLAMSPDGKSLATGDSAGTVTLWDLATSKAQRVFVARRGAVVSVAFSKDGKVMATAHADFTLGIWNVATGKHVHDFAEAPIAAKRVAFTMDGKAIMSVALSPGPEKTLLRFWDPALGKLLRQVPLESNDCIASCFSADGSTAAVSDRGKTIRIKDLTTNKESKALAAPAGWLVIGLELTADGRWLAARGQLSAGGKGQIQTIGVWDVAAGKMVFSITAKAQETVHCQITPDTRFLVVHSTQIEKVPQEYALTFWDIRTGQKAVLPGPPYKLSQFGPISPSGRMMATYVNSNTIGLCELSTGSLVASMRCTGDRIAPPFYMDGGPRLQSVVFSPNGRTVAARTDQGGIFVWSVFSAKPFVKLSGHRGPVWTLCFTQDGNRLVSTSDDSTILVWDLSRWTEPAAKPAAALTAAAAADFWNDLAADDAAKAHFAIGQFLQSPQEAMRVIREKLPPFDKAQTRELAKHLADLDSDVFATREQATAKLQALGFQAQAALEKALAGNPTLEVRRRIELLLPKLQNQPVSGKSLQALRALEIAEMLATEEARAHLESLAAGEPDAWLTQEAAATLERVRKRK